MKLNVNTDATTTYAALGNGQAFHFVCHPESTTGGVFIKSRLLGEGDFDVGTRLADGLIVRFTGDTKVTPLDLVVVNA